ncbi:hypothetical protein LINGRAHAP2_LOCUS4437, partial [Linum grandiflorum]
QLCTKLFPKPRYTLPLSSKNHTISLFSSRCLQYPTTTVSPSPPIPGDRPPLIASRPSISSLSSINLYIRVPPHDGRVLRDAVSKRNGLKVPKGLYYLADTRYTNCQGFLTLFRGQRYNLSEWGPRPGRPNTPAEYFNDKHSSTRNVIERAFELLKMRWVILLMHLIIGALFHTLDNMFE